MMKENRLARRRIKLELLPLLEKRQTSEIFNFLERYPDHLVLNTLFSALCNPLDQVRWNAVMCFGTIVPRLAEERIEEARVIMRRFLWSLNDESGGIGWGAPESLAEIMCHCGQLRREYLHMLISYMCEDGEEFFQDGNYLELPMLQRGLLWGIGRLCQCHRDEMIEQNIVEKVAAYLSSTDSAVSGLAIWSLGLLQAKSTGQRIAPFLDKVKVIQIYKDNFLQDVELGFLAEEALQALS